MGYFTTNNLGDITSTSRQLLKDGINLNDNALFDLIDASPADYKFLNEEMVHVPRPSVYHRWNGGNWFLDITIVEAARITVIYDIKRYRDMREEGGVIVNINSVPHWFHSDTRSLIKYLFLAFLATVLSSYMTGPIQWKTMDSDDTTGLTVSDIVAIVLTVMSMGNALYGIGRGHTTNIQSSLDPYGYNYKTGWPPIYGE